MCMIAHYSGRMTENYENVNHLVLNFYPDGYSIAVKLNEFPVFTSETILETAKISYEETGLLDYIANEELPPLLVEMIDSSPKLSQFKIWRDGCLVLEVRDKIETALEESQIGDSNNQGKMKSMNEHYQDRSQSAAKSSHMAQSNVSQQQHWLQDFSNTQQHNQHHGHHNSIDQDNRLPIENNNHTQIKTKNYFVVLKPTNLSMLYDVLNLTSSKCWSAQQRLQLESQIVLYNSPDLFLEPDASKVPSGFCNGDSSQAAHHWFPAISPSGTRSDRYPRFDGSTKPPPGSSHKNRLKSIYLDRPVQASHVKTNGNQQSTHHPKMNNLYYNPRKAQSTVETESLPQELTLQQFIASKRAKRKKSLPFGQTPKFHRFKRNVNYK